MEAVLHRVGISHSWICLTCKFLTICAWFSLIVSVFVILLICFFFADTVFDTTSFRNTGSKERIWESDKEKYFETVVALMSDENEGDIDINQLKILTSKESKTENTQYYMQSWPEKKTCQLTNFPHPYPQLASLQKEMIRYERKDGVQLTATLYLPPGYDPTRDGPLPCLVWSYPGEFKSKDAAGQVRGSPNEFAGIGPTSALLWLARRHIPSLVFVCLNSSLADISVLSGILSAINLPLSFFSFIIESSSADIMVLSEILVLLLPVLAGLVYLSRVKV